MMFFSLALLMVVGGSPPQEVLPMPDRLVYNRACLESAIKSFGTYSERFGWHWNSTIDRALGQAFCTCEFEMVKDEPIFTGDLSHQARQQCGSEFDADQAAFLLKYTMIHREMNP